MDWAHLVDTIERIHDDEPQRAAELLEANLGLVTSADEAERFTTLVNHIFGETQKDWGRAATLNRRAVGRITEPATALTAMENLSVSQLMAGHLAEGLATELEAVHYAGPEALACAVAIRLRVALFLLNGGERTGSVGLFLSTLKAARSFDANTRCDRTVAVTANNFASALLDLSDRSPAEDRALEQGALTARDFWFKAGTWVNHERADYLLALTYNALRRYELAYEAAQRGLALIAQSGKQDIDRAFLLVEVAFSGRHLERVEESADAANLARELGAKFEGRGLQEWFAKASAKLD